LLQLARFLLLADQGGGHAELGETLADQLHGEREREEPVVGRGQEPGEDDRDPGGQQLQPEGAADQEADPARRGDPERAGLRWLGGLETLGQGWVVRSGHLCWEYNR
jgi:hypothetical protein